MNPEQILYEKLVQYMLDRVESGEISPSELKEIRQFLKDQNITQEPVEGTGVFSLADALPYQDPHIETA